jgi:hypothetical protein
VYEERDARTTLLSMVQALNHAKHGVDIVSGTRVNTFYLSKQRIMINLGGIWWTWLQIEHVICTHVSGQDTFCKTKLERSLHKNSFQAPEFHSW